MTTNSHFLHFNLPWARAWWPTVWPKSSLQIDPHIWTSAYRCQVQTSH